VHTFVRPLVRFPRNFEARAKANAKGLISPMTNERMLLNNLLSTSSVMFFRSRFTLCWHVPFSYDP
jgi:hypothetical protein